MELEAVGGVAMRHLRLKIRGQVDDVDGAKWALLGTNTTSDA
jgi:hypothetical protein